MAERLDIGDLEQDPDGWARHPEGGRYTPVWRSDLQLPAGVVPGAGGPRDAGSCIAYRLRAGERARWHRVRSTELWLWQGGGALRLRLGGSGPRPDEQTEIRLGPAGVLQAVVAAGHWQTAEPAGPEEVVVACVVVPGFDWADWEVLED